MESSSGSLRAVLCCPKCVKEFCTTSQNICHAQGEASSACRQEQTGAHGDVTSLF